MTTIEEINHLFKLISMDWQFIHGAQMRMDYKATDMSKILKRYQDVLKQDEERLLQYPKHWVEAVKYLNTLK